MTEPQAPQSPSPEAPKSAEAQVAELLKAALSRRVMFGASFLGAAALLAQACSSSNFAGATGQSIKKAPPPPPGQDGNDGTPVQECAQIKTKNACTDDTNCQWDGNTSECSAKGTECSQIPTQDACAADNQCQWNGTACEAKPGTPASTATASSTATAGSSDGTGGGLDAGADASACYANSATNVNASGLADATGGYLPAMKFYGRDASGMVALQFGAGAGDINQVILTKKDGTLLALHGITGADKKGDAWRPIVIDNISLTDDSVIVVIQAKSGNFKHTEPKAYFKTYNGKTVVDLSGQTVPAAFLGHQSVTRFGEGNGTANDVGSFKQDPNEQYPGKYNGGTPRLLNTAQSNSTWTPVAGGGIMGTVTDVMGNPVDLSGSGIIEYQLFCTYVDCGDGTNVARTMLHIG